MSRDDAYLYDILESARVALSYAKGMTWDQFSKDLLAQDAVIRRLEVIGEAASRVSPTTQEKYAHLPWKAMKGTRNVMIHQYDSIQLDIIWNILQNDLPPVVIELEKILSAK
jgi:uncharacterized protein with HEPN domain